jgi:hypothetical protein
MARAVDKLNLARRPGRPIGRPMASGRRGGGRGRARGAARTNGDGRGREGCGQDPQIAMVNEPPRVGVKVIA